MACSRQTAPYALVVVGLKVGWWKRMLISLDRASLRLLVLLLAALHRQKEFDWPRPCTDLRSCWRH
jgi:hypothetical protein